ncbi:30S ribosomal protein S30e [archaeon]|nr:MAG: 30S ribosomal protein S30e [archaeon]RLG66017.1 MAG: 30S ribosomal protein S30e [archaeon]HDM24208.1 30S ribosomal protein S30e [Candidatus Bathyarchaeota archaeon]
MPGSHGSLTKAGKVRSQTPKIPAKPRKSKSPRVWRKVTYRRRFIFGGKWGQQK